MSSPAFGALYGGYKYESPEARALGSITTTSYDYRDQGKFMSKMAGDVSYMAAYMRKMQKGIDDANQNIIQQIQSLIEEIIVLFGGGGDTGFDFGDLKYILQAFGAFFGFQPGMQLPINLFGAAWHFFFNYIVPLQDFKELFDTLIDASIATMLDMFGEVPIVGQAVQQLAVILSTLRDQVDPWLDLLGNMSAALGNPNVDPTLWNAFWNNFGPVWDFLYGIFQPFLGPTQSATASVFSTIGSAWGSIEIFGTPLVDVIPNAVNFFANTVENLDLSNKTIEEVSQFWTNFNLAIGQFVTTAPRTALEFWEAIVNAFLANIQWFKDIIAQIGNPLGLGTGDVTPPSNLSEVPVLGPVINWIQGSLIDPIVGGTSGTLPDLATQISDGISHASVAFSDWSAALTASGHAAASDFGSALQDAGAQATTAIAQATGAADIASGTVDAIVQAAQANGALVNQTVAEAKSQLEQLFSSAPQQLQGLVGTFGVAQFGEALGLFKQNTTATQQKVLDIADALNAVPSTTGTNELIDFTGMSDQSDMTGVMDPGTGDIGITSGQAKMQNGNTIDVQVFPTEVDSDYVVLEATIGSLFDLTTAGNGVVGTAILARCDNVLGTRTMVGVNYYSGSIHVQLLAVVNSTIYPISSAVSVPAVSPDGVLKVIMGDNEADDPYTFEVLYNGSVIIGPVTDSAHNSKIGTSQRLVGIYMISSAAGKVPPGIKKFKYYSNEPNPGPRPFAQLPPNKPEAPGGLYIPSDTGGIWRDNGENWVPVMGGPLTAFTSPPDDGWIPLNVTTQTFTRDKDAMLAVAPYNSGQCGWVRPLSPTSGYNAEFYIDVAAPPVNNWQVNIVLRNSSNGYMIFFGMGINTGAYSPGGYLVHQHYYSVTSFAANVVAQTTPYTRWPNFFKFRDDGANRYLEYSYNGMDWTTFTKYARNNWTVPDQIGIVLNNLANGNGVPTQSMKMRVRSLSIE